MKTHIDIKPVRNIAGRMLAGIFVVCLFALAVSAQAPPDPIPAKEAIPPNSLIIPMDNVNQGNAAGTTFNLRAYGLANQILHGNIPVKWAIAPGKSKDADDFAANVTRVAGSEGVPGPAVVSFSGGPFIVSQKHAAAVMTLITTFNSGPEADVTVYRTNESKDIDVRYNLNHKPKIAIGPDGGNFGAGVHQALFDSAGIGSLYYTTVSNDIIDPTLCYTLATQAQDRKSVV